MRLVLFRHGPAGKRDDSRWPDDAERPLTPKGAERVCSAAHGLARFQPDIRLVLTSPLERAVATARILEETLDETRLETLDALRPGGSFRRIVEHLAGVPDGGTVVLVGHEPDLGKLAGVLVFGAPTALPLKKAGAAIIDFDGPPAPGRGRLVALLPPRILRRLAPRKHRV